MSDSPTDAPSNLTNELAKERNRAAAERTLMAWIRTNLALIGFGVGIDRVVAVLNPRIDPVHPSHLLGLAFIGLGVFAMVAATAEHIGELRRLEQRAYVYLRRASLGMIVGILLSAIGVLAFFTSLLPGASDHPSSTSTSNTCGATPVSGSCQ